MFLPETCYNPPMRQESFGITAEYGHFEVLLCPGMNPVGDNKVWGDTQREMFFFHLEVFFFHLPRGEVVGKGGCRTGAAKLFLSAWWRSQGKAYELKQGKCQVYTKTPFVLWEWSNTGKESVRGCRHFSPGGVLKLSWMRFGWTAWNSWVDKKPQEALPACVVLWF